MLSLRYNVVSSTTTSNCQRNSTCEVCPTATHTTDHNMTIQRCVPRAPPTKLYVTRCYSFYYHTKVNLLTNRPIICNNKAFFLQKRFVAPSGRVPQSKPSIMFRKFSAKLSRKEKGGKCVKVCYTHCDWFVVITGNCICSALYI